MQYRKRHLMLLIILILSANIFSRGNKNSANFRCRNLGGVGACPVHIVHYRIVDPWEDGIIMWCNSGEDADNTCDDILARVVPED